MHRNVLLPDALPILESRGNFLLGDAARSRPRLSNTLTTYFCSEALEEHLHATGRRRSSVQIEDEEAYPHAYVDGRRAAAGIGCHVAMYISHHPRSSPEGQVYGTAYSSELCDF